VTTDEPIDEPDGVRRLERLPPRPGPELDRVLDAVERCITRYGLRRTSMSDIAREMGVARTTLYRQVSSLDEAMALVSSRRFHRFLDKLLELSTDGLDADAFVQVIVRSVRMTLAEPVMQRLLHDEPEILGAFLTSGSVAGLVEQFTTLITPAVRAAMGSGLIRTSDPTMVAAWVVRVVLVLTAVPAPDDELDATVRFVLLPMLDPSGIPAVDGEQPT
jgi:AcrR family transcriptional regulator